MEQGQGNRNLITEREKQYLSKLCWLLHDAGTFALRTTFNSIHPPLTLKDHLGQTHIRSVLNRLHQQKAVTEKQWKILYPLKGVTSSQAYDSRILVILLQTICHLSPPYPNGWASLPLPIDKSLSADVVRLQILFQQIGSLVGVRHEEYPVLWRQIVEVLLRHGGSSVKAKIQRIDSEELTADQKDYYIEKVKEVWGATETGVGALKHLNGPRPLNKPKRSRSKRTTDEHQGLSLEDKFVLSKMSKLLVDNVVAEDIIDRLQQGQIIKITDRQEIMALSRNSERMQYILAKIQNSKLPFALKLLCDALKFKYNKIYNEVTETRRITHKHGVKETRDMVGLCSKALKSHYLNVFSKVSPLPWNDNLKMSIPDFYTKVDIVSSEGKSIRLPDILPERADGKSGKRVVLEGEAGSGKSTLASMLTFKWASNPAFFSQYYRFLILVDAQACTGNIRESVYQQCMSANSKLTCEELWETLEDNPEDAVFIIDGFTGGSSELTKIMDSSVLRNSAVLVLVNPNTSMSRYITPDYKLFNVGLNPTNVTRCLRVYAGIVRIGSEDFDELLEALETWPMGMKMYSPFVCMAIIIAFKYTLQDISMIENLSSLFESYVKALAVQFCRRHHILEDDEDFGELVRHLKKLSFNLMTSKKSVLTEGEIMGSTQNIHAMKFGILQRSLTTGLIKGHCTALTSYMSAKYLAEKMQDDLHETLDQRHILKYTRYADVVSFLCSLIANEPASTTLETIINEMLELARKQRQAVLIRMGQDDGDFKEPMCNLVLFIQTLQSLADSNNSDIIRLAAEAFPRSISLHKRGLYPIDCLRGFSRVLESGFCHLTQFEMAMHPFYLWQQNTYTELATALSKCQTLRVIKATWTRIEMLAKFMATATRNRPQLDLVQIDCSGKSTTEETTAVTWDDLQTFCENLCNTDKFVFRKCSNASIVGHVVNSLPKSIKTIDFSNTAMNLICATDLASYLEHSRCLKSLDLTNTGLEGSAVVALSRGMKLSSSVEDISLCDIQLDRLGVMALGRALCLVTTLKSLDIGGCELTEDMHSILSAALEENHSLSSLLVSKPGTKEITSITRASESSDISVPAYEFKSDQITV